eukprot:SAG22_NODE_16622_length_321_cov_0.936937_2_plen_36_part_01
MRSLGLSMAAAPLLVSALAAAPAGPELYSVYWDAVQ